MSKREVFYLIEKLRGRPLSFLGAKLMDIPRSRLWWVLDMVGRSPYSSTCIPNCSPEVECFRGEFFFGEDNIPRLCELAKQRSNWVDVVNSADMILQGRFRILGRELCWDEDIGWNDDPTVGFTWPRKFHSLYRYSELVDVGQNTDIKVPWEMGRLQFLPLLAMAYRLSADAKYISKLDELLDDWHRNNRVGWGVGWACTMDVSLRAISLIWVAQLMAGTSWLEHRARLLVTILAEHGRFIYRNIEYSDINGNHHTACLLGLLYLGLALKGEPESGKWLTCATKRLQTEIVLQTYDDGVCHEGSIPYHGLVTEMFLHAGLLCRRNHIALGSQYWQRLERMLSFVLAYTKPNGKVPLFGDNDAGRVVSFGGQEVNDHRYLLDVGSVLLRREDMKSAAGVLSTDALWIMGVDGFEEYEAIMAITERREPKAFPCGGYWVLRNPLGDHVTIDCGDVGLRGRGGHGHLDTLSVEANLAGRDALVDTGCFTYSASREYRRRAISARAHNAVIVDGIEPAPIREHGIASVSSYEARAIALTTCADQCSFTGEHFGYTELPDQVVYRRTVSLDSSQHIVRLSESLSGMGGHHLAWRFHLAPDWSTPFLSCDSTSALAVSEDLAFVCIIKASDCSLRVSLERSEYFPSYGVSEDSWTIVFDADVQLPYMVTFTIMVCQY